MRLIKKGYTKTGKQRYAIRKDKENIKSSINKEKLKKWFKNEYPDEKLVDETN